MAGPGDLRRILVPGASRPWDEKPRADPSSDKWESIGKLLYYNGLYRGYIGKTKWKLLCFIGSIGVPVYGKHQAVVFGSC